MTSYDKLQESVNQWATLDNRQWQRLAKIFTARMIKKGDFLLLPGSMNHELVFVSRGLLRFFYNSGDGSESNKAFIAENSFAGPLAASTLSLPVIYGIQALEDTELLVANYEEFTTLFDIHPVYDRIGRKLAEQLLIHKEIRARSLLIKNATDRYLEFVERFPNLLQRIPQYHIASYLGITEVSLSRLRKQLAESELS